MAKKSYHNPEFLNSRDARPIRILCEYEEPEGRFRRLRVQNTVVFFGSARTLPSAEAEDELRAAESDWNGAKPGDKGKLGSALEVARRQKELSRYYEDAVVVARELTQWSREALRPSQRFYVCSGGGPGIMEAANRGASQAGGRSIGLNVSLPTEQMPNPYQSPDLSFEFHYFFMRKFWFVYLAKAILVFPGGFGTLDEMFELLTLVQTQKMEKRMPIVLYGTDYWKEVLDLPALAKWGTIDEEDLDLIQYMDDPLETFRYLKEELTRAHLKGSR